MKTIPLTQGKQALVDDADFDRITGMGKWQAQCLSGCWYATMTKKISGKKNSLLMHRVILSLGPKEIADHKDRNGLNNQRENLRPCTPSQNSANQWISRVNKTGLKGVSFHKGAKKWHVRVSHEYVGLFETKQEAAKAYNRAAKAIYGEFAVMNPESERKP